MKTLLLAALLSLMLAQAVCAGYYWPSSARTPARVRESWVEFDRIKMRECSVRMAGATLEFSFLANYAVGSDDDRWNVNFVIPEQPKVKIGVATFRPGDWVPGVNADVMKGYLAGLRERGMTDVKSSAEGQLEKGMMVLGTLPEIVEYTEGKIRRREYWVEAEGRIFVFGFEAPVALFDGLAENARIVIARATLAER